MPILIDDKVWFDEVHKVREVCREIQESSINGQNVLVPAHFEETLVGAPLRQTSIQYRLFSSFEFSELYQCRPANAGGAEAKGTNGRIWRADYPPATAGGTDLSLQRSQSPPRFADSATSCDHDAKG